MYSDQIKEENIYFLTLGVPSLKVTFKNKKSCFTFQLKSVVRSLKTFFGGLKLKKLASKSNVK